MDEDREKKSSWKVWNISEVIIILLLLGAIADGILGFINGNSFIRSLTQGEFLSAEKTFFEGDTLVGKGVSLKRPSQVFSSPGGDVLATLQKGAEGIILGGPRFADGEKFWFVEFSDGTRGWVKESDMNGENGRSLNSDDPVGSEVLAGGEGGQDSTTSVLDEPGGDEIGEQENGAEGEVVEGPRFVDGKKYWKIDFDNGADGWVEESSLVDENGNPLLGNNEDILGKRVGVSSGDGGDISIYNSPGGQEVGTQERGTKGIVTDGPIYRNGERYWKVDFESGVDGWVKESDLRDGGGGEFDSGNTPIGEDIVARGGDDGTEDSPIFASPEDIKNGLESGFVKSGTKGVVVAGPWYENGERYWYVEFENGQAGWIAEGDMKMTSESKVATGFSRFWFWFKILATIFCMLALTVIVYSTIRLTEINNSQAHLYSIDKPKEISKEDEVDPRWQKIERHIESENPSDWRLSILEADIVLEDMMEKMGYMGETLGEKLKSVERSDFTNIDFAWEAHLVRNKIAHEGSDFLITQREAKRVLELYRRVFEEFKMKTR